MKYFLPAFAAAFAFALLPALASAATLGFGGPSSVNAGSTFTVPVLVSTAAGESANAFSGTVTYPANLLTLIAISKTGSIVNLWPSDPTQGTGSATFEGIVLNPGYSGTNGTVVTLTFEAKAVGTATVAFSDASVLANDGNATPILSGTSPASILIKSAPPSAPVKPITPPQKVPTTTPATGTATSTPVCTLPAPSFAARYAPFLWSLLFLIVLGILLKYLLKAFGYEVIIRRKKHKA